MTSLEGERDFYFGKLRDIEIICQDNQDNPIVPSILEIMYATQVRLDVHVHGVYCNIQWTLLIVVAYGPPVCGCNGEVAV